MGGLVFRSNGRNISFKDPIYTNGKYYGTRHLCLRTGAGSNDVVKYGLTSNRSASEYCPMKLRVDGKDAYIGKISTSGTYREIQSQYTSREVDVTYSSTSSGGGTYTYPTSTTYEGASHTGTVNYTYTEVSSAIDGYGTATNTKSMFWATETYPATGNNRITTTVYTSTYEHGGAMWRTLSTTAFGTYKATRTLTRSTTYTTLSPITGYRTATRTEIRTTGAAGDIYTTTVQSTAYHSGSGTYIATSYTYKDDGYNTWYNTYTSTNPSNINM